jgi:hypothetical protein
MELCCDIAFLVDFCAICTVPSTPNTGRFEFVENAMDDHHVPHGSCERNYLLHDLNQTLVLAHLYLKLTYDHLSFVALA